MVAAQSAARVCRCKGTAPTALGSSHKLDPMMSSRRQSAMGVSRSVSCSRTHTQMKAGAISELSSRSMIKK
jgi:hypothetical protein